ncbi:uncharacterized protein IWZ02DRAFT_443292 [Phyllosticta citriasiana]|uniref:uncharacterized protein n=1 Tax=Phyllosticta citriasiana TaxID=595635 RepID=UPI0030FD6062
MEKSIMRRFKLFVASLLLTRLNTSAPITTSRHDPPPTLLAPLFSPPRRVAPASISVLSARAAIEAFQSKPSSSSARMDKSISRIAKLALNKSRQDRFYLLFGLNVASQPF